MNILTNKLGTVQQYKVNSKFANFKYSSEDVNNNYLPVVITAPDAQSLAKMKELVGQFGVVKEDLPLINGFTAEVDPNKLQEFFKSVPDEVNITLDQKMKIPDPIVDDERTIGTKMDRSTKLLGIDKLWEKGLTGYGVGIAIVDTGVYPNHKDLRGRVVGFQDSINTNFEAYDDHGHGTHVAGIAAGNGRASDNKFMGIAPDAAIIGVKVLSKGGSGSTSQIIQGVEWVINNKEKYNIQVMNLSLGGDPESRSKEDPLVMALEKAIDAGIVPCIAAGNSGPDKETIGSPGITPNAITVGAYDDKKTPEKEDDDIARFSSRGPSIDGNLKPEIIAPGVNITAPLSPGSTLDRPSIPHIGNEYITISGTSMATPMIAGIVALLRQAAPQAAVHDIKRAIVVTAAPLVGKSALGTGAGLINPEKALEYLQNLTARSVSVFPVPNIDINKIAA